MLTIRQLNQQLRDRYEDATNIRHYQQLGGQGPCVATLLTTSRMPNTNQPGRIFAGYTDDLRATTSNLGARSGGLRPASDDW